jgi:glycosyltransferase involved in cell wall biosynthesis
MDPCDEIETSDPGRLVGRPLVSVLMVAYNHQDYLAEAIEGVLAQRCDFEYELLIGEDCSRDETRRIALAYQARYPHVIRVIHSARNVGGDANINRIFARARGTYVAYCDGDDYWCAPDKLSRQVALIEHDPAIGAVHTDWVRARKKAGRWHVASRSEHAGIARRFLEGDLFRYFYFPKALRPCTLLYRRSIVADCMASELATPKYRFGDTVIAAYVTSRWRVGYVGEVAAVYRESPNSALRSGIAAKVAFLRSALDFDASARRFFAWRADYPDGYRWELGIGLLLAGCRARDVGAVVTACRDLSRHFGLVGFVRAMSTAIRLRWPHRAKSPPPGVALGHGR